MNYLGHLYLSGPTEGLIVGNFIGDAVKGNQSMAFPEGIKQGVFMHRKIDNYTDNHQSWKTVKRIFNHSYGRYSGVVTDLVFDHILASRWDEFHILPLSDFINNINRVLLDNYKYLPFKMQIMLPFWVKNRWPELYATKEGLERVLKGMSMYTSLPDYPENFYPDFDENKDMIMRCFNLFLADIKCLRGCLLNDK